MPNKDQQSRLLQAIDSRCHAIASTPELASTERQIAVQGDDALRVLVRLLAQQAARDWFAGSSHSAGQPRTEQVIDDQA